jgi:hypothetical protein
MNLVVAWSEYELVITATPSKLYWEELSPFCWVFGPNINL